MNRLPAILLFCLLCLPLMALAALKPNIIVIMADDLGYGDVSCYGATAVQTPAIDRLAREGVRFTSGYCSASTCTPTRFSLLTGTYALYHLPDDPGERNDLSSKHPAELKRLQEMMEKLTASSRSRPHPPAPSSK